MSKTIENILIKRDGITREEARNRINETREMMLQEIAEDNYDEAEEILYSELGIELDYIFEIFGG